ncbi:YeiH family protein [Nitrospinota bacterium]
MAQAPWWKRTKLLQSEDYWAIWLGLLIIAVAVVAFWSGGLFIKHIAVTPGKWGDLSGLANDLGKHGGAYLTIFLGFLVVFSVSMAIMGIGLKEYIPGFVIIFLGSLAVFYLASWEVMKRAHLGAPLLALIVGLIISNAVKMPAWFKTALRVEYYIKTGIVLLGATLPLTLIYKAGGIAFVQATIVSVATWFTIYLAATRIFKLDNRFGAVLGAGGAVCGVSASIAVGGAVRADKDQIAIGIGVVSVWAIIMIFALAFVCRFIIPPDGIVVAGSPWYVISPGEAGAWIGTSEYADAAGFAVATEVASRYGDTPIHAFTLMKVIGRDIWIGIWALILSIVSVALWEKGAGGRSVGVGVVWERFPKFVLGFFGACFLMSIVAAGTPGAHLGVAKLQGTFKSKAEKIRYDADFSGYRAPSELADRFQYDPAKRVITFKGKMSLEDLTKLAAGATTKDQRAALKQLHYKSDWEESELRPKAISPIKKLRSWAFVLCFLSIGLTTRFRDLATFGIKPFWAFTIGVIVNVPLGWILSTVVFQDYWRFLGR